MLPASTNSTLGLLSFLRRFRAYSLTSADTWMPACDKTERYYTCSLKATT